MELGELVRSLMPSLVQRKILASPHAWGDALKTNYAFASTPITSTMISNINPNRYNGSAILAR